MVTPADVARVRAATGKRTTLWTLPEIEATLPKAVDAQALKFTASVNPDAAAERGYAARLEHRRAATGRACGSRSSCRRRRRSLKCSSIRLAAGGGGGGGGRGGRGAAPAAPGAAPVPAGAAPAPAGARRGSARTAGTGSSAAPAGFGGPPAPIGYPRAYTLQTSIDGTTWSKPVAEGKGEGSRTSITFPPTKAKFLRITQSETAADAPPWSISNLRVYEAPAGK